ncbi:MAG TPA: alpha/beta fold hydrolase [Vicinamibacteria bacterium]
MQEIRIPAGDFSVTASRHGKGSTAVVLGHGAGGDRSTRMLVELAETLAESGRQAVLYNFPYSDHRRRAPDPPDVLERTARAAGDYARGGLGAQKVVLGGKSMGGRIASQAVAKGAPAEGLVFLGYPLHPPGRTRILRDRHLPDIAVPMLFVQGTRDAFARWDLLEALRERLSPLASLHRVDGGDHSFGVPKRSGRKPAEVQKEVFDAILGWLEAHGL